MPGSDLATLVVAGFAGLAGLAIAFLGFACIDAGRGGYGHGPFPFLKQRTDWGLLAVGTVLVVVGSILFSAATEVLW